MALTLLDDLLERAPVRALDPLLGRPLLGVARAGRVAERQDRRDLLVVAVSEGGLQPRREGKLEEFLGRWVVDLGAVMHAATVPGWATASGCTKP